MHRLAATPLTPTEEMTLESLVRAPVHHRQPRRAQAVLAHSRGASLQELARHYAVRRDTVRAWLTGWQEGGVAALAEGRRAGRPPKLAPAAQKK